MAQLDSLTTIGTAATVAGSAAAATVGIDDVQTVFHLGLGLVTIILQIINFFKKKKTV